MTTVTTTTGFKINGVVDTNQNVMENINRLASAAGCWATFDIAEGKWAVVINQPGTAQASFDDSNIIGSINLTGRGLTEFYNRVEVGFPHRDLNDQRDYIGWEVPVGSRFPNEPENTLTIEFDLVNDPIQAGLLGARELKQSRVDKVITFATDFTNLGIKAGDLISVTNSPLGFTNKLFRVVNLSEIDGDSGEIVLEITAIEYDANVYNTDGLIRTERNRINGIRSRGVNEALDEKDTEALVNRNGLQTQVFIFSTPFLLFPGDLNYHVLDTGFSFIAPYTGVYKIVYEVNWGGTPGIPYPPLGVFKNSIMYIELTDSQGGFANFAGTFPDEGLPVTGTIGGAAATGGDYEPSFLDHFYQGFLFIPAGVTVNFGIITRTDYPEAYVDPYLGFPPQAVDIGVLINGEVFFIGAL